MNRMQLKKDVKRVSGKLLYDKGHIAPVDLLMGLQMLTKEDYEKWRFGRVPFLQKVCRGNLKKLAFVLKELRSFASDNGLVGSWTAYSSWGKGRKRRLRFSKSGSPVMERQYSTHFVNKKTGGKP